MCTPSTLSAVSHISCYDKTVYVAGSGGAVTLTDTAWIAAGSANGQECRICGSHATNTVTAPDNTGVRLAGDTGSVTFGDTYPCVNFAWTGSVWRQEGIASAVQGVSVNKTIGGLTLAAPLKLRDGTATSPGTNGFDIYGDSGAGHMVGICGGSACSTTIIGTTNPLTLTHSTGVLSGLAAPVQSMCQKLFNVAATPDDNLFWSFGRAVTITGVWCNYEGSAPSTAATFTLEDGSGNAMTITGTNPTCAAPGTAATVAAVTAGNSLTAREPMRYDVTNTPNPATDEYL